MDRDTIVTDRQIKHLRIFSLILCVVLVIGGVGGAFCGYKLYRKVKDDEETIARIEGQTDYLQEKLNQATDYYNFQTDYSNDTYNYFAIGNSLTLITSWGRGICSTKMDNDYFHLVEKYIQTARPQKGSTGTTEYSGVTAYPYNFAAWERAADRNSMDDLLDVYLSDKLDLVTIQLSENCVDVSTLDTDLEGLVDYVHEKAPNAQIIIIGDFWDQNKSDLCRKAAEAKNVPFADLSPIIGDAAYQSKAGTVCEGPNNADGSKGENIIVPEKAASHPGDKGMKYIADTVTKLLK